MATKDKSKPTEDKEQVAAIFNSFCVDSVQCLAKNFGERQRVLKPVNNNLLIN